MEPSRVLAATGCPVILPLSPTPKMTNPPRPLSMAQTVLTAAVRWPVELLNSTRSLSPLATMVFTSSKFIIHPSACRLFPICSYLRTSISSLYFSGDAFFEYTIKLVVFFGYIHGFSGDGINPLVSSDSILFPVDYFQ
jgi:hypothetical protein